MTSRVYALANQKGGVGKTTTAINMAACVAEAGTPVLLIDLDPQANATTGLGYRPDELEASSYDLLHGRPLEDVVLATSVPNLDLVPSHPDLAAAQVELSSHDTLLRDILAGLGERYPYVFVDCPPSLGLLTVNALSAANRADRAGAVRVLRARGSGSAAAERGACAHPAQPAAGGHRRAADDVRQPHPPGPRCCRPRCASTSARWCSRQWSRAASAWQRLPVTECLSRATIRSPQGRTPTTGLPWRSWSVAKQRGLGRGLAALVAEFPAGQISLMELAVSQVRPNPRQPRHTFSDEAIAELSESIRSEGVVQPIIVRDAGDGFYELVAGERRWRAAQIAELTTIPAIVRPLDERESLIVALAENVAREDLNAVDQARAYAVLSDELGLNQTEIAKRVGKSRPAVANTMRLLELPDERARPDLRGHAVGGPRPRRAAGRGAGRAAGAGTAGGQARLVGSRDRGRRSSRTAEQEAQAAAAARRLDRRGAGQPGGRRRVAVAQPARGGARRDPRAARWRSGSRRRPNWGGLSTSSERIASPGPTSKAGSRWVVSSPVSRAISSVG